MEFSAKSFFLGIVIGIPATVLAATNHVPEAMSYFIPIAASVIYCFLQWLDETL